MVFFVGSIALGAERDYVTRFEMNKVLISEKGEL
jgi:hypothetical protein